jgi:hypothetical protein
MNHEEAGRFWNANAEVWTKLARAGYDNQALLRFAGPAGCRTCQGVKVATFGRPSGAARSAVRRPLGDRDAVPSSWGAGCG